MQDNALNLLTDLFAAVKIHDDQPVNMEAAIKQSKTIAKVRKENATLLADAERREAEFERMINDPAFRVRVMLTIVEEEGVDVAVAMNRTVTKAKLSQEALKYDLI